LREVTALMSVYNGEKFIEESIQSILNQSYSDFELLIVDDCSTDNTVQVIKSIKDERIRLIELKENVGVGAALRYSLDFINSKYVIKVDSDDINHKDRFLLQKEYMDKNTDVTLCKTLMEYFSESENVKLTDRFKYLNEKKAECYNRVRSSADLAKYIEYWFCVPHYTIMIRTDILIKIKYDPIRFGEDYNLIYKLNKLGYKMGTVEKKLVYCRVRKDSLTGLGGDNEKNFERVFDLKSDAIGEFFALEKECYIWGTGTLAKSFYNKLNSSDLSVNVLGFIDGTLEKGQSSEFLGYCVNSKEIAKENKKKIIIAASPAIFIAMEYLDSIDYELGKNYYIF